MTLRAAILLLFSTLLTMLLSSCGGGGSVSENQTVRGYNPGVGPFDSRGNYVEKWADDKSKGRWWRKSTSKPSAVAKREKSKRKRKKSKPEPIPAPVPIPTYTPPVVASYRTPLPRPETTPRPVPLPSYRPVPPVSTSREVITPRPPRPTVVARATPKPRPKPKTKPRPKPRPKPVKVVHVKPKHKAPIRHTIKKGDTLYSLSRRYNTTVTAIQRANGLKGTNLVNGRSILIPRY